jgi:acyl-CoA thioester hydrolase
VRYGECDQQGVVFNPRYAEYVDLACTEFLNIVIGRANLVGGGFEVQVVKLLVEWKGPARYDDVLEIAVATKSIGNTSFVLKFDMRKFGDNETIVTAETVNVHVDPKTWAKRPIAEHHRIKLMSGARGRVIDHAGAIAAKST